MLTKDMIQFSTRSSVLRIYGWGKVSTGTHLFGLVSAIPGMKPLSASEYWNNQ